MTSPDIELIQKELSAIGISAEPFSAQKLKEQFTQLVRETSNPEGKIKLIRGFLQLSIMIDPDSIEGFLGIRIVEKKGDGTNQQDCFTYLFGPDADAQQITDSMVSTHEISQEPVPGSYVLYLNHDLNPKHIGNVTSKRTVISKWGLNGHVYEHPPILIPLSYGSHIAYFTPPKT